MTTMAKMRRAYGLPKNDAADKIWADHIGNNAFVRHRDQCATCLETYRNRSSKQPPDWCPLSALFTDEDAQLQHHISCAVCMAAYRASVPKEPAEWCPEGDRIFNEMLDEVYARMDEARENQN